MPSAHTAAGRQRVPPESHEARPGEEMTADRVAKVRLLTSQAVLAPYGNRALTNREAWAAYEALAADDRVVFRADEPPGIEARWKELAVRDTATPKRWMDAYLAAFAATGAYRMITTDSDFERFERLQLLVLG